MSHRFAFKPATFDHANFPKCQQCHQVAAPPKHYPGQCSTCHATTAWQPATFNHAGQTDCAACHTPDRPANHFPGQRSQCHNTNTWGGATFTHHFPLNHGDANGVCSACHPGNNTGAWSCAACHSPGEVAEDHDEVPNFSQNCLACHPNGDDRFTSYRQARRPIGSGDSLCRSCLL